jgi:hypothetical protein
MSAPEVPAGDGVEVIAALDALLLARALFSSYGYHQAAQDATELLESFVAAAKAAAARGAVVLTDVDVRVEVAERRAEGL